AKVSQQCNQRYLAALASVDADQRLMELAERLEQATTWKGKRVRGLHPLSGPDSTRFQPFQLISRGEETLCGFRNADLQSLLFSKAAESPEEKRRRSAWVSRRLRLLRAHHLIKKMPHENRYHLTEFGRTATIPILF